MYLQNKFFDAAASGASAVRTLPRTQSTSPWTFTKMLKMGQGICFKLPHGTITCMPEDVKLPAINFKTTCIHHNFAGGRSCISDVLVKETQYVCWKNIGPLAASRPIFLRKNLGLQANIF